VPNMFDEMSALQKEIRRGKEQEAMHWAVRLEQEHKNGDKILWSRLLIIASEDVGLADPSLISVINDLRDLYFEFKYKESKGHPERLFLSQAILLLCRSKKSRIVNDFLQVIYNEIEQGKRLEVPKYAEDGVHTAKGKEKGGIEFFFNEASKLENEASIPNIYRKRAEGVLKKLGKK
jgi:replication-associated recombination protein RarA